MFSFSSNPASPCMTQPKQPSARKKSPSAPSPRHTQLCFRASRLKSAFPFGHGVQWNHALLPASNESAPVLIWFLLAKKWVSFAVWIKSRVKEKNNHWFFQSEKRFHSRRQAFHCVCPNTAQKPIFASTKCLTGSPDRTSVWNYNFSFTLFAPIRILW